MKRGLGFYPYGMSAVAITSGVDHLRVVGADLAFVAIAWARLSSKRGVYDWSALDAYVAAAEARGMAVHGQLVSTPYWVRGRDGDYWYPPVTDRERTLWREFVTAVVRRYGTRIAVYEVWNEPNLANYWKSGPDPAMAARLQRASWEAAHAANAAVVVANGGISRNDAGWLAAVYDASDRVFGKATAKASGYWFDWLSVHPYSPGIAPDDFTMSTYAGKWGPIYGRFVGYRALRAMVESREGRAKPIVFGEFGYPTVASGMKTTPDDQRAAWLPVAYDVAAADGVWGMTWYTHAAADGFSIHGTLTEEAFAQYATGG